jgi:hypothetical protein
MSEKPVPEPWQPEPKPDSTGEPWRPPTEPENPQEPWDPESPGPPA